MTGGGRQFVRTIEDRFRWVRPPILAIATVALIFLPTACSPGNESAEAQVDGEHAYTIRCGYCHDVPNGIGAELTPRVLAAYSTVGALDSYLRFAMPHETPGSLPSAEYDAILAYLIESRELVEDGGDVRELPPSTELRVVNRPGSPI